MASMELGSIKQKSVDGSCHHWGYTVPDHSFCKMGGIWELFFLPDGPA